MVYPYLSMLFVFIVVLLDSKLTSEPPKGEAFISDSDFITGVTASGVCIGFYELPPTDATGILTATYSLYIESSISL